jgi:hypothetical protein
MATKTSTTGIRKETAFVHGKAPVMMCRTPHGASGPSILEQYGRGKKSMDGSWAFRQ